MSAPVQKAPGELELVRRFVNTNDVEDETDELATPDGLRNWLAKNGLEPEDRPPSLADVRQAIELREALRALLLANNGEPFDRGALSALNAAVDRAGLGIRFDTGGHAALSARAGGTDGALGLLLGIVFRSMADGTWSRLKACRSRTCQWAFYDKSRNRSARWCTMAVCGNRAKARTYRRRQSTAGGANLA